MSVPAVAYSGGMDYQPSPEPPTDPYSDPTELNRLFDELVLSSEEADAARSALIEWQTQTPEPKPPKSFEGTNELVEYRQLRAAYQLDFSTLAQRQDDTQRAYLEKAEEVAGIIPQDSRLAYQDSRGRRYEIIHRSNADEQPVVVFKRD